MERSTSRRKADRLLYELEDCLSLMERKHGLCDASVMEASNVAFSARDDCSFEYSEIGDLTLDNSQSLMDETNGPLLLAIVEEYILGQRLQMMATGESDDDEVSPTSSFESETCCSHENSGALRQMSVADSFFSGSSYHGSPHDEIEIQESTVLQNCESTAKLSGKSRWQSLLLSLSNPRYNATKYSNRDRANSDSRECLGVSSHGTVGGFIPSMDIHSSLSKRNSNGESTPTVLHRRWDRLKAVNPLKRSVLYGGPKESDISNVHTAIPGKSLYSPSESSKLPNDQELILNSPICTENDVLKSSSVLNSPTGEKLFSPGSPSIASSKKAMPVLVEEADLLEAEPSEGNIQIFDENNNAFSEEREYFVKEHLKVLEPVQSNTNEGVENLMAEVDNITRTPDNELVESINADKEQIEFPEFNESIEVPNEPIVEFKQNLQKKALTPVKGKGRLTIQKRFSGNYSHKGLTQTETPIAIDDSHVYTKNSIQKPVLCSHCRCKLSEQSICAAMASESLDSDAGEEKGTSQGEIFHTRESNLEEDIVASNERLSPENHVECIEKETSMVSLVLPSNQTERKLCLTEDPLASSDIQYLLGAIDKSQEMKPSTSDVDCPSNKIEAKICSPQKKSETPTIHIEFRDWIGNEVEIVQDSPQKRANRMFWKQGIFSNKESTAKNNSPHNLSQELDSGKNNEEILCVENTTAEDKIREDKATNAEYTIDQLSEKDRVDVVPCTRKVNETPKNGSNSKKKYFGMISKRSRLRILKKQEFIGDEGKHRFDLIEQPFHEESNIIPATTNVVDNVSDEKMILPAAANKGDSNEPTSHVPKKEIDTNVSKNEEALLLEKAMKEIHTDAKYDPEGSKTRSFLRSPVTLYRFLDYNPCRNELVNENSYDAFADPVGISVAELFAPKACFAKQNDNNDGPEHETQQKTDCEKGSEKGGTQSLKHPSSNTSLKKVFRRLSKKVAFRENLIDTSPREKNPAKVNLIVSTLKKQKTLGDAKLDNANLILETGLPSTSQSHNNQAEVQGQNTLDERKIPEDIFKKLLKETSKKSKASANVGVIPENCEGGEIIECIATKTTQRKASNSSPRAVKAKRSSAKKSRSPKTKGEKDAKTRAHAERVAQLLTELKKVNATGKIQNGRTSENTDEESPTQRATDGTVATLGTRQSHTSSLSRLTTEEQKLARRMINDIQLLAKIEKKRRSSGNKKSSLKNSDMDRTLKLLLAMEASRRSRIPASTKVGTEVLISPEKKIEENCNAQSKEINSMKNMESIFGGLSFFTDAASKTENN